MEWTVLVLLAVAVAVIAPVAVWAVAKQVVLRYDWSRVVGQVLVVYQTVRGC
jgi:hypothetical protein